MSSNSAPGPPDAWLQQGIDNGYCSEPFCATHIAPPGYDHDGDGDECIPSVRVYPRSREEL